MNQRREFFLSGLRAVGGCGCTLVVVLAFVAFLGLCAKLLLWVAR